MGSCGTWDVGDRHATEEDIEQKEEEAAAAAAAAEEEDTADERAYREEEDDDDDDDETRRRGTPTGEDDNGRGTIVDGSDGGGGGGGRRWRGPWIEWEVAKKEVEEGYANAGGRGALGFGFSYSPSARLLARRLLPLSHVGERRHP